MLSNLFSESATSEEAEVHVPKKWTVGEKALFASLPCWSGEGTPVRQWIKAWQQTKDLIDWNGSELEQIRCFRSKLHGMAWEWMIDQESSKTEMWSVEHWEAALVEAFAVIYHPSTAVLEFYVRRRGVDESVDTYAFSLLRLAHQTGQKDRDDLAEAFIAGLGEEMVKEIRTQGEMISFEEAWGRARTLQAKMNCFERYGVKDHRKCYSCGVYGHYQNECPSKSPRVRRS